MPYDSQIARADAQGLIPEDVSREIWKSMPKQSAAMSLFRQRRLSRNQQRVPVLASLPSAYFVSGDTGKKQTTKVSWENKYFDVEELAVIVPIPEAVLADADYDIWGEIRPLIEEAIGRTLDAAIFFGTNKPASWPAALVTQAVAAGNTVNRGTNNAAAGGIAADFSALFGTVEGDGYDVNGVVANVTYKARLRNARDSQGRKLDEIVNMVSQDQVFGVPVQYPMRGLWPAATTGNAEAFVGDWSTCILGIRQDMTWKLFTEGVIQNNDGSIAHNLLQNDMVAMRVVFRVAWQTANPINYDQQTEANRFPYGVMLVP